MNPYFNYKDAKAVVLCAGRGTRMHLEEPKVLVPLGNKPVLCYAVDYWRQFIDDFIFVVGYKKDKVCRLARSLPIKASFVEQKQARGIADAIYCARHKVSGHFIVVLGDCICQGKFRLPDKMIQGIGVHRTSRPVEIRRSYSVKIKNNLLSEVVEKPKKIPNNLCGMGFYFFDQRVFGYIKSAKSSPLRNEIEITDVIQAMIDNREEIKPVFFQGDYININYVEDLKRAGKIARPK